MFSIFLFVTTLLLIFWLFSLVWSQSVARGIFKWTFYAALIMAVIMAIYVVYQGYRWGFLLNQLNERSLDTTALINPVPLAPAKIQN